WVRPGSLPRLWALARAARSLMTVAIGLVPVLLISGFVEAFVTPSGLPAAVRIAIGAGVWIAFLVYMLGRGRQVHRRGITGDLSEEWVGNQVGTAGSVGPARTMSSGEQAAMTTTRHGAPADAARVLRRSWPHLPWTDVRIARGAFHHVLLLPPR